MGWGGARKGSGRKPKPLAEKLAAGNPGHRPLKKIEFAGEPETNPAAESKLTSTEHYDGLDRKLPGLLSETEIHKETVKFLESTGCLHLIFPGLIEEYVLAKYYLQTATYELAKTATVGYNDKHELVITSFAEAMLKMQKNVIATWSQIWDIVSRNSERLIANPEQEMLAIIMAGRSRKKPKGEPPDGEDLYRENPDIVAKPVEV
jgi:hypothetical protein